MMAVPINKAQSEKLELICIGESSKKANGIAIIKPTILEYNVIVRGSTLLAKSLVIIIIIAKVTIVTTIHNKPLSICMDVNVPFVTTKKIPMIATIDPINIRIVNLSFKNMAAKILVKIGVVAKINADIVGSAVCNPLKKDHWLMNTPITPSKKTERKSVLFSGLNCFLSKVNPIKKATINNSLNIVSMAGEKSKTKIFPNIKLLPHTTTQKVSQEYAFNIKTPSRIQNANFSILNILDGSVNISV